MLSVDAVSVIAGRAPITFEVSAGRCLGLQGTSALRTSLMLLAAGGMVRPITGKVLIDGHSPLTDPAGVRRTVAMTRPQCVDPRLRLHEYLQAVSGARAAIGTAARASIKACLDRLGLDGSQFLSSSTARAEASLAAALLPNVGLVVLDEPFAGLRADTRERAIEWIRALADGSVAVLIGGREERDLRAVSHTVLTIEPVR